VLLIVTAAASSACAGLRSYGEVRVLASSAPPVVRADGKPVEADDLALAGRARRVVIEAGPTAPWRVAREALADLAVSTQAKEVVLEDGARSVTLGLPRGSRADGLTRLWIVDVAPAARVTFGLAPSTPDAVVDAASAMAVDHGTRFLVRGEDPAMFGDVMTVVAALERVAPGRTVVGALSASMTRDDAWEACPFPPGHDSETAFVALSLDVRADGKAGVVSVDPRWDAPAFGPAAAFCAARQRVLKRASQHDYRVKMRFVPRARGIVGSLSSPRGA
jgi:hypothetical protein